MPEPNWDLLQALCAIHAVSGREDAMIAYLRDLIRPLVDQVTVDRLGNVVGILQGQEHGECTLMLQAHMDELGLIVRNITERGFLLFERVGGVPEKSLLGQRVEVLTEQGQRLTGYVGVKSHHITSPQEKYKVPAVHEMFIDLGLGSRQAVEGAGVQVGDPIAYQPNFQRYGEGMVCSKALDDRVGVFILLEVLKALAGQRPPCTIAFAFTVLEEFSIRGSLPAVRRVNPAAILSLDITVATDTPIDEPLHPVRLGGGPAVKMMDFHGRGTLGGMFSSPRWRRFIESIAQGAGVPLQREVIVGVITDPAFQLYLGDQGQVIAGISIPQRYTHAAIQTCNENDIRAAIRLVEAVARAFDPQLDLSRG